MDPGGCIHPYEPGQGIGGAIMPGAGKGTGIPAGTQAVAGTQDGDGAQGAGAGAAQPSGLSRQLSSTEGRQGTGEHVSFFFLLVFL
jgi:hypothetical protein